jgi:hypothetical protein
MRFVRLKSMQVQRECHGYVGVVGNTEPVGAVSARTTLPAIAGCEGRRRAMRVDCAARPLRNCSRSNLSRMS